MLSAQHVQKYITDQLPCTYILVSGDDGTHFEAVIVSTHFTNQRLRERHQLVYRALGEHMRSAIHALSMHTYTPEEWALQQSNKEINQ